MNRVNYRIRTHATSIYHVDLPQDQHGQQPTFWKYNFIIHMSDKLVIQSTDLCTSSSRAGIQILGRKKDIPDSDAFEAPAELEGRASDSPKRDI